MITRTCIWILCAAGLAVGTDVHAQSWSERLRDAVQDRQAPRPATGGLSAAEMDGGLREALAVGVERAINGLARPGGYLDDPSVRIPLPGVLERTESALRMIGQGAVVDEFLLTVNRAAEQAVPQAASIVGDTIRAMTISDAQRILTGPDDAATRYFQEKNSQQLAAAMLPIVRRATGSAGVTRAYKDMIARAGPAAGLLGGSLDIDEYVTAKTLDGLFLKVAAEEKAIRANPAARATDLLKKVFGAVSR